MLVSSLIILVPLAVAFALALGALDRPRTESVLLIFLLIYLFTLSLFGIALPAAVARDNTYRIVQGLRATFSTMWRLVLGPGVAGFLLIAAAVASGYALGTIGATEDSLIVLGYNIALRTLGFLTTIVAVAVLCEMYHRTRPARSG